MPSFVSRVKQFQTELAEHQGDPLRDKVRGIMRGKEAIGTAPLLDLLGMAKTTGNGRRIATTMRSLGYVPMKSRRLMPGGYRDTVTRGWAQPVRASNSTRNDLGVPFNPNPTNDQKDLCHVL